jgi:hypothetical protein
MASTRNPSIAACMRLNAKLTAERDKMCTHAGVVSQAECPWCRNKHLRVELETVRTEHNELTRRNAMLAAVVAELTPKG